MKINAENCPTVLTSKDVVSIAYGSDIETMVAEVKKGSSILIKTDKECSITVYQVLKEYLRDESIVPHFIEGRNASPMTPFIPAMVAEIKNVIETSIDDLDKRQVVIMPYFDLIVSNGSSGDAITTESKELFPLFHQAPNVNFIGFCDPSFSVFKALEKIFIRSFSLTGINRNILPKLLTNRVVKKFPKGYNFQNLYKYLSGQNPVRILEIVSNIEGLDYPENDSKIIAKIRDFTCPSGIEIPNVDLNKDIGGYENTKKQLTDEILSLLKVKEEMDSEEDLNQIDSLLPKGIIFYGPPGTGKTFFGKAMATALNSAIFIVSGPELKSMWVGKSEENIREVFQKARASAPSIIIFDEIDSFAGRRDTGLGSGSSVNHGMVNQLLTEMDGFRKEEQVFIIGTTNFHTSLDPALLRPGRFELKLEIPYPSKEDKRCILGIYNQKFNLGISEEDLDNLAERSDITLDSVTGQPLSGDHINAIMRHLKRIQIREKRKEFTDADYTSALRGGADKREVKEEDKRIVAYHEAGHAIVSSCLKDTQKVARVTIDSDFVAALGFVQYEDSKRLLLSRKQLISDIITLLAGRESEEEFFQDITSGSSNDIERANSIARHFVSVFGMSSELGVYTPSKSSSESVRESTDKSVQALLKKCQTKCREYIKKYKSVIDKLANTLLEKRELNKEEFLTFLEENSIQKDDFNSGQY